MQMKKRIVSALLSLALVLSMAPMAATAAGTYSDTAGHWAEAAIERFSGYGIVQGNNGKFNPDNYLSRAEMAAIISRLVDLPEAESAGFTDVADSAWYADVINRCAASGIMQGYNGLANPKSNITRQDAIVMLARTLGIEAESDPDLSQYTDADQVSDYAKGYVAAMSDAGIVNGVGNDQVGALRNIKRSEAVTILDRAISAYANEDGQTVADPGDGIVLVVADNVTITGDVDRVIVTPGASGGTVTLTDANVSGDVTVQTDANVVLENTTASSVTVSEGAKAKVSLDADTSVDDVNVSGAGTELQIAGNVGNVTINDTASNSVVTVAEGGTLQRLYSDSMGSTLIGTAQNITSSSNETMPTQEQLPANADDGAQGAGTDEPAESNPVESNPVESQNPSQSAGGNAGGGNAGGGGTLATYNVSFETNGGSAVAQQTVTVGTAVATVAAPTKTGYTFAGWYSNADLTTAYDLTAGVYNNLTLYAAWTPNTYTVSYNSNSGSGTTASGSMTYGVSGTLASSGFTRTGYTFAGWNTAADGNGTAYTAGATVSNLTATNGGTVTLYAQWTPNTYTITFNANGGTGTMTNQSRSYNDDKGLTESSYALTGYDFNGWNTKADGTGTSYGDKQVTNLSDTNGASVTLYAQWKPSENTQYKVEHYKQNVTGDGYTLVEADTLTKTGTTGANTDTVVNTYDGFTSPSVANVEIKADGSTVVVYRYVRNTYDVTFDVNGDDSSSSTSNERYGATVALPTDPTRTGYTFAGWYYNTEDENTKVTSALTVGTADTTLHAKWTINSYTVTFVSNGGSDVDPTTVEYNKSVTVPENGPTKTGYIFDGWYDDNGGKVESELTVTGNITLTAKWKQCDNHDWKTVDGVAVCNTCAEKQSDALKFELEVSSKATGKNTANSGIAAVTADVYDDYSVIVTLPDGNNDDVSLGNVTIYMLMQNVAGLGVSDTKEYNPDKTPIQTGLGDGASVGLANYLASCYKFENATVKVDIDGKTFSYEFTGTGDADSGKTITGKVSTLEDAQAAWAELTSDNHISSGNNTNSDGDVVDDSYIIIANGSTLQIGQWLLSFENTYKNKDGGNDLKLDNITGNNVTDLMGEIQRAVTLTKVDNASGNTVEAVLKKGTTLAVSSSKATLEEDATIKVTGLDLTATTLTSLNGGKTFTLSTVLDQLKSDANVDNAQYAELYLMKDAIAAFDALVGAVDNGTDVSVNVTFSTTQTETSEIDNPNAD
jgi:uncharacterized repeat protein (TIGR02543 family)